MATTLETIPAEHTPNELPPQPLPLTSSVLGALAYADLFDAPLSLRELEKYQIASRYSAAEIEEALLRDPVLSARTSRDGDNYCLKGRESLFDLRHERAESSERVWKRARLYARWLSRLPFVRMVAVTGALAVNNLNGRDDIDLLVVSSPGRVWLCRRGLIGWVRVGRLLGDDLCPNFILSEASLELAQRDFFTAHELAQMVPLFGRRLYEQMLASNLWARSYLPALAASAAKADVRASGGKRVGPLERVMQRRGFDRWERWELERLRRKLRVDIGQDAEVVLTPDQCKGHTGLHRKAIMTRFMGRLAEMGLDDVVQALEFAAARNA